MKFKITSNSLGYFISQLDLKNKEMSIYLCVDGIVRDFFKDTCIQEQLYFKTKGEAQQILDKYMNKRNFTWAIEQVRSGKKVKRPCWDKTLELKDLKTTLFKLDDIDSYDYFVVPEPINVFSLKPGAKFKIIKGESASHFIGPAFIKNAYCSSFDNENRECIISFTNLEDGVIVRRTETHAKLIEVELL